MNPDTNRFEPLDKMQNEADLSKLNQQFEDNKELLRATLKAQTSHDEPILIRPDGSPVPKHWSIFTVGEKVAIKNYTFRVGHISESTILFEPVGPVLVGENDEV